MAQNLLQLTGSLARAARALVGTSAADTAEAAGIGRHERRAFGKGGGDLTPDQTQSLRLALERFGAFFIADGANRPAHRAPLKLSAEQARRVETSENEGGLAAADDV